MASVGMASLLANMKMPNGVNPVSVNLPPPPKLEGALTPNNVLSNAIRFADNVVDGPESMVVNNAYVYTGLADGYVVEVRPNGTMRRIRRMSVNGCGRSNAPEGVCGRPLGIREHKGYLIVADAYHGIIALNPVTGDFQILVDGRMQVKGKRIGGFINDLAVANDGSIYFTTSSSKYTRDNYLNVILEGELSGRVLVYNARFPGRQKVRELVTNLNFPNGLQLSKSQDYLLIAEGARARIHKAYIDRRSPKFGRIETFASNLPGFVDNIRASPRGTYWVGLSRVRHEGMPSVLDDYGNQPRLRGAILGMPREALLQQAPKYGMVVELNDKGQIIRSLHDPTGVKFVGVSEVEEEKGILYIGSFDKSFIGILRVADLPPIQTPDGGVNQQLAAFLQQIRDRMMNMGPHQVRDVVIALVQHLVQVKLDAMKAQARAEQLEKEVQRLQAIIDSTSTPTTPAGPITTPSSAQTTPSGSGTTSGGGDTGTTAASGTTSGTTEAGTTSGGGSGGTTAAGTTAADTTASGTTAAGTTAAGTTAAGITAAGTTAAGTTAAGTTGSVDTTAAGTTAAGTTASATTSADATGSDGTTEPTTTAP